MDLLLRHSFAVLASLVFLWPADAPCGGVVTTPTEANLRSALNGGGTVIIACDGVIKLATNVLISADTFLDGNGHDIVISGDTTTRVFSISFNVTFSIRSLTVADGMVFVRNARPVGTANALGGGIWNTGRLEATACVFSNNVATTSEPYHVAGGGICNQGAFFATNCVFVKNIAWGWEGRIDLGSTPGAKAMGGALFNSGSAVLVGCHVQNNQALGGNGVEGVLFTGDSLPGSDGGYGRGGGIYNSGALRVYNSTLSGNGAVGGVGGTGAGGESSSWGLPPGTGAIGGLGGDAFGGGIFCAPGSVLELLNTTFFGNTCAAGDGGQGGTGGAGLSNPRGEYGGLGGNGGTGGNARGGALALEAAFSSITNATISSGHVLAGQGGAGGAGGPGTPTGPHGFDGYAGEAAGGNVHSLGGTFTLRNSILAYAAAGGNFSGTLADAGYNLSSDESCQFTSPGSLNNTDPLLGGLAYGRGAAPTCALLQGSPAIDVIPQGDHPPTDQAGFLRPIGPAADIGAIEFAPGLFHLTISAFPDGTLALQGRGVPLARYRLLTSGNLVDWVNVSTNLTAADGWFEISDSNHTATAVRFYRVLFLPSDIP